MQKFKGPIATVAAGGAILSGLVGYYTTYKTVVSTQSTATADSAAKPDANSIAVLPFVNMSSDKDQEYFSDGLSEELLNQLAQVPQLKVIARTSSFAFKGKQVDVAAIAKELKVGHMLEGSVRKSGSHLRISAQLIRTSDSTRLWSQTFDRQLNDVFAVQDEISQAVVGALKVKLLPQQSVARAVGQTTNPQAYTEYLLGRSHFLQLNLDGYKLSKAALQRAIALDATYALAYAQLALSEVNISDEEVDLAARKAGQASALAWAEKAIALEPKLAWAYVARSRVRVAMLDFAGALADARQALTISPDFSTAHLRYGKILMSVGSLDEALAALAKATDLDPLAVEPIGQSGLVWLAKGDHAKAQAALTRSLQLLPNYPFAQYRMFLSYLLQGDKARAEGLVEKLAPRRRSLAKALLQVKWGSAAQADEVITNVIKGPPPGADYEIASLFAFQGQSDKAIEWLQRADERGQLDSNFKMDPLLASLHRDPRFNTLLKKMGVGEINR